MTWDKQAFKKKVQNKKDGETINWSEVAHLYHVTNKTSKLTRN